MKKQPSYLTIYNALCEQTDLRYGISVSSLLEDLQADPHDHQALLGLMTIIGELKNLGLESEFLEDAAVEFLSDPTIQYPQTSAWIMIIRELAVSCGTKACEAQCRHELEFGDESGALWYFKHVTDAELRKKLVRIILDRKDRALMTRAGISPSRQFQTLKTGTGFQMYQFAKEHFADLLLFEKAVTHLKKKREFGLVASIRGDQINCLFKTDRAHANDLAIATAVELGNLVNTLPKRLTFRCSYYSGYFPDSDKYCNNESVVGVIRDILDSVSLSLQNLRGSEDNPYNAFSLHFLRIVRERVKTESILSFYEKEVEAGVYTVAQVLANFSNPIDKRYLLEFYRAFEKRLVKLEESDLQIVAREILSRSSDREVIMDAPHSLRCHLVSTRDSARLMIGQIEQGEDIRQEVKARQVVSLLDLAEYSQEEKYNIVEKIGHLGFLIRFVETAEQAQRYYKLAKSNPDLVEELIHRLEGKGLDTSAYWHHVLEKARGNFDILEELANGNSERETQLVEALLQNYKTLDREQLCYVYCRKSHDLKMWALKHSKFNLLIGIYYAQGNTETFESFLELYRPGSDSYNPDVHSGNSLYGLLREAGGGYGSKILYEK